MSEPILRGIRVLDLAHGIAGPVAAMLLAEAGADVVKVETAAGSAGDRALPGFLTWNRSKRSVAADLTTADGQAVLQRLLACADVVIHNFAPDQAVTLGLDDASLAARYPRLIISSVLGWPANHEKANLPVDDMLTLADLGICDEQMPLNREGPIYVRAPFASWAAAYLAAIGITARLLDRQNFGVGGGAHTSLVQGALVPMGMHWSRSETPSALLSAGMPKETRGSQWTLFECSDGRWIHTMPPGPDRTPLMQKLIAEMSAASIAEANATVPASVAMAAYPNLGANRVAMLKHTSTEWLTELWANDVPAQLSARYGEVLDDPQAIANGYVTALDSSSEAGADAPAVTTGFPFAITPRLQTSRPAPKLGEHTDEVLAEWLVLFNAQMPSGSSSPATVGTHKPLTRRGPLDGLRVLDCGNFLAGPYGPQVLADLGATVIKLEAHTGDPMRFADWPFAGCQRGKRGLALNLKSPAAAPIRDELIRWADVVHHNLRLPAARKLGLDEASVRAVNPDAIFCHVSSYGPEGDRADWPGYDQLFQAQCGWEVLGAGDDNPPMWHRFGFMDHLCALSSALGTLLARFHQINTGLAQDVRCSLLGAGAFTNSETYKRADGTLAPFATLNHEQTAVSVGRRIAQTSDGWIAIAADEPAAVQALLGALGVADEVALVKVLERLGSEEALAKMQAAGVTCGHVRLNQKLPFFDDQTNIKAGLVAKYTHGAWGVLEQPGALWHFGDLDVRLGLAPPILGEHTIEILQELGQTPEQIAILIADGVVVSAS
jgi:crotonobetainyl-CoA:carnitine CoA-transferase CaiB-like acyl-CoA transferase